MQPNARPLAPCAKLGHRGSLLSNRGSRGRRIARVGASTLGLLALLHASIAAAIIPPYTDHEARQNLHLVTCRENLNLAIDLSIAHDFDIYSQAQAVICELTAQERGLGDNLRWGAVSPEAVDSLVGAMSARAGVLRGIEGTSENPLDPPCGSEIDEACYGDAQTRFKNRVILRFDAFFLTYIAYRFPDVAWSQPTKSAMHVMAKEGNWSPWGDNIGNSVLPLTGMRLFAGELFGDSELYEYGRTQLYQGRDEAVRNGLGEPMATHYGGLTLSFLAMMLVLDDEELREIIESLLSYSLIIPAHLYLPGGALGSPQERETGGGGVADPDPNKGVGLSPTLEILVGDPDVSWESDPIYLLAADYQAPEILRSIFLDKEGGYTFRYRGSTPPTGLVQIGWYEGRRHYPSQGLGISEGRDVNPWQAVVLPDGNAQMGFVYGSGGMSSQSSGLYVKTPNGKFSILYHHQPRFVDPMTSDPLWVGERKSNSRRMMLGRTRLTLFDATATELPSVDPTLEYTMAHLPDFSDPTVGDGWIERASSTLSGATWLIGQSGSAYVAFLPLGDLAAPPENKAANSGVGSLYSFGPWIYLEFDSLISGNVTELATTAEYATIEDYADDLADRHVSFSGTSGSNAVAEVDVRDGGLTSRIRLEYGTDGRFIDGVQQLDGDFLALPYLMDSPFLSWDESSFTMTVSRTGYDPLVLNLGDPATPTTPARIFLAGDEPVNISPFINWHAAQDDVAVVDYDIYRDGQFIGLQSASSNGYQGGSAIVYNETHPTDESGLTRVAKYQVAARDADGNVSPTLSMILEVTIPETDLDGDGVGDASDDDDDGDGLLDIHETSTGLYVSSSDTGSQPLIFDSDQDGFGDGAEVSAGSDPNDPLSTPAISVPALGATQQGMLVLLLLCVVFAIGGDARDRIA